MSVIEEVKPVALDVVKNRAPALHNVVILNDNYTPMEFVVEVLAEVFQMNSDIATKVMMQVHYQGKGVCGQYPLDIAETKAARVVDLARAKGHPLMCRTELS